jgi:two-component system, cell cycle response regulator DivK
MPREISLLYVEDDAASRKVMQAIVENMMVGYRLAIFEDSGSFMERVRALPVRPDLILMDVHIRPHDGFEMLRMLRGDPEFRATKVIALTASVMNEEVERLRASGFDGAIGKPLRVTTFPDLISHILNGEAVWHVV